jgi:hypothetical protein
MDHKADVANLLELAGVVIDQEEGFWVKIEAWRVPNSAEIPHGIRYSLTQHAPDGSRILGYDNAHAIKESGRRFGPRVFTRDHRHRSFKHAGEPHEFTTAYELLSDFFKDVDQVMRELR